MNKLSLETLGRGYTWLDAGTPNSLLEASQFVQAIEHRQGLRICCPEEIAYNKNWLSKIEVLKSLECYGNSDYSEYIKALLSEE